MSAYNQRHPAVKRIVQELKELQREDDPNILAEAIEDNIFEWHFAIRGAWDSEFEGGIYHGRILMPAEYPFKPPAFVMLTPSGRFETGVKICLSISSHHPESWQPSWSVRSALVALIAFMQTPGSGALGSLDHPAEARRQMAAEARARPPAYGTPERQQLIDDMHRRMLDMEERSRRECCQEREPADATAAEAAPAQPPADEAAVQEAEAAAPASPAAQAPPLAVEPAGAAFPAAAAASPAAGGLPAVPAAAATPPAAAPAMLSQPAELRQRPAAAAAAQAAAAGGSPWTAAPVAVPAGMQPAPARHHSWEDRGLTYLAVLLALCIAALVIRKVVVAFSFRSDDLFTFNHVEGVELFLKLKDMLSVFSRPRSLGEEPLSPTGVKRRLAEHASLSPEEEEYVSGILDALYTLVPRRQHAYVTEHYFGGGCNGIAWLESMTHGLASDGDVSVFFKGTLENNPADCEDADYILQQYKEEQGRGAFQEGPAMHGLAQLRGPWAFVAYDRGHGRILAARDPAGVEPLFWGSTLLSEGVLFASEKSLIEGECADADAFPAGCIFVSDDFSTQGTLSNIAPTHQGDSAEAAEQRQQASALCRVESSSQLEAGASHSEVSAN